jgi:DNA-binding HxlR family transcriptional regulator
MADSQATSVPRQPEEPTPEQVREEMNPCEPYTVKDFEAIFEDTSRWTIQRRLDTLVEDDVIEKKKHAENRVSYWIPE